MLIPITCCNVRRTYPVFHDQQCHWHFFLPKIATGFKALSINKWVLFGNQLVVPDTTIPTSILSRQCSNASYYIQWICTCCSTKLDKNKHKTTEIGKTLQICINFAYKTKNNQTCSTEKGIHRGTGYQWKGEDYVWDRLNQIMLLCQHPRIIG